MFLTVLTHAEVYEDAEDGLTTGWRIIDNIPIATINNVAISSGKAIALQGNGRDNLFILGGKNNEPTFKWNKQSSSKQISWKMKFDARYYIYVYIETTSGSIQRIRYSSSRDHELNHTDLRISLGRESDDGEWITVERDLEEDLKTLLPDDSIVAVNGFMVQGSGMVDDISFGDEEDDNNQNNNNPNQVVYENGDNIDGWELYPNTDISNELISKNDVIQFRDTNYFILGGTDASTGWNNQDHKSISWKMKFNQRYYVYVYIETSNGTIQRIRYSSSQDHEINHTELRISLGRESDDGEWVTVNRNLEADLHTLLPNESIVAVHGFMIQTTSSDGMLDDVALYSDLKISVDALYSDKQSIGGLSTLGYIQAIELSEDETKIFLITSEEYNSEKKVKILERKTLREIQSSEEGYNRWYALAKNISKSGNYKIIDPDGYQHGDYSMKSEAFTKDGKVVFSILSDCDSESNCHNGFYVSNQITGERKKIALAKEINNKLDHYDQFYQIVLSNDESRVFIGGNYVSTKLSTPTQY